MSLVASRNAIVTKIKEGIPQLLTCQPHGGRFDRADLMRYSPKAPAVLVGVLDLPNIERQQAEGKSNVLWALFVITKDKPEEPKHDGALALVNALGLLIPNNRWGLDESIGVPMNIRAQNLYTTEIDKLGCALWGVTWSQLMSIGGSIDELNLDDFLTLNATHDLKPGAGEPTAVDNIELPQ